MGYCKNFYRRASDLEGCCLKGGICPYKYDKLACPNYIEKEIQKEVPQNPKDAIDWEEARIRAAIAAMQGILTNDLVTKYTDGYATRKIYMSEGLVASKAIAYAEALVEKLKKEK